jgi:hypothetical protein
VPATALAVVGALDDQGRLVEVTVTMPAYEVSGLPVPETTATASFSEFGSAPPADSPVGCQDGGGVAGHDEAVGADGPSTNDLAALDQALAEFCASITQQIRASLDAVRPDLRDEALDDMLRGNEDDPCVLAAGPP